MAQPRACGHTVSHRPWSVIVSLEFPDEIVPAKVTSPVAVMIPCSVPRPMPPGVVTLRVPLIMAPDCCKIQVVGVVPVLSTKAPLQLPVARPETATGSSRQSPAREAPPPPTESSVRSQRTPHRSDGPREARPRGRQTSCRDCMRRTREHPVRTQGRVSVTRRRAARQIGRSRIVLRPDPP